MANDIKDEKYAESMLAEYSPEKKEEKETPASQLHKLEKKATLPPKINAWVMGSVYTVAFGAGFAMVLGSWETGAPTWVGYVISAAGMVMMAVNYFIYVVFKKSMKKKYGPEIVELSKSMLN